MSKDDIKIIKTDKTIKKVRVKKENGEGVKQKPTLRERLKVPSRPRADDQKPLLSAEDSIEPSIVIKMVRSYEKKLEKLVGKRKGDRQIPNVNDNKVYINCSPQILKSLREIIKGSGVVGSSFDNPYTHQKEYFPNQVEQFEARHFQMLARNEEKNTSGRMKVDSYQGLLTEDQVARIRCLVKATTVTGVVNVQKKGGFPKGNKVTELAKPQKAILIDQSGLQWQGDFRNTGGMFFYQEKVERGRLPEGYQEWQKDMYKAMYGSKRPDQCSDNNVKVTWRQDKDGAKVSGKLDLDQVSNAISYEFIQALESANAQAKDQLDNKEAVNFRYLKAGTGFFADGIGKEGRAAVEKARLVGVKNALKVIENMEPVQQQLLISKIGRMELPFSTEGADAKVLDAIKKSVEVLGIEWGGAGKIDALDPPPQSVVLGNNKGKVLVNATTNCADPHAMIGNEGGYSSVDAMIVSNSEDAHKLNAVVNGNIKAREIHQLVSRGNDYVLDLPEANKGRKLLSPPPIPRSVPPLPVSRGGVGTPPLPLSRDKPAAGQSRPTGGVPQVLKRSLPLAPRRDLPKVPDGVTGVGSATSTLPPRSVPMPPVPPQGRRK